MNLPASSHDTRRCHDKAGILSGYLRFDPINSTLAAVPGRVGQADPSNFVPESVTDPAPLANSPIETDCNQRCEDQIGPQAGE